MNSISQLLANLWASLVNFIDSFTGSASQSILNETPKPPTLTPAQALAKAEALETNRNPRNVASWQTPSNVALFNAEILNGGLNAPGDLSYLSSLCGGTPAAPNISWEQASALAIQGAQTGVALGTKVGSNFAQSISSAVPIIGSIASGIISIVSAIFAHHAAAVQRDNAAQCHLVPAANNAFAAIIQAVKNGTITPTQGSQAILTVPDQFIAGAGAAYNHSPYCNALCEDSIRIRAIAFYWDAQFKAM